MKLRDCKVVVFFLLVTTIVSAQYTIKGKVKNKNNQPVWGAEVYNRTTGKQTITDNEGSFEFIDVEEGSYLIAIFSYDYEILEKQVPVDADTEVSFNLVPLGEQLSEVIITQRREKVFGLKQLKAVEGTAIYDGKKSEVVLLSNVQGNLASNNARQIYAQVAGLNIYENSSGGLQLNIGGRGLDPNRTANFNTRQNGYDISADVLGYPESYYTPPPEALEEIQVVRGAASLQYGTQFGGLLNFKMKKPTTKKKLALVSRQTLGSYNLFTSFNSLSGTVGKFSYYTYFNYKQGDGFRPNSEFESKNAYIHLGYQISERTKIIGEYTYLDYLAQQPGGLTDERFRIDPTFSNRTRNWFDVNWNLFSLKLTHEISQKTDLSINLFGLNASRSAVGFRGVPGRLNMNPIDEIDEVDGSGNFVNSRDLIVDNFRNWGAEARLLTRYKLVNRESVFLIGSKYYQATNDSRQGSGGLGTNANFDFQDETFPDYPNQSSFDFPNINLAVFGENIFRLSDKFSITPGFRFEYIKTESEGFFNDVVFDNAGNPIANNLETDNRTLDRSFFLFGIGSSYKLNTNIEAYANVSQNYRSITFSDIRVVSPTFRVDPEIGDEKGFTADVGVRGRWNNTLSYDVSVFGLVYDDRIGIVFNNRAERVRGNIGDALIYGVESFLDWNIWDTLGSENDNYRLHVFANTSLTTSEYTSSDLSAIEGNKVEFIPEVNLKAGLKFGYKNVLSTIQYTYLSEQFTDVSNAGIALDGDNRNGIIGEIPSYGILDLSLSYTYKRFKLETGVNNLLDENYFTQRATGYPGPGIIPSDPLTWYTTLQFKW